MGKKSKDFCSLLITSQTDIHQYSKKKINLSSFEQGEIISLNRFFNILGKYINFWNLITQSICVCVLGGGGFFGGFFVLQIFNI